MIFFQKRKKFEKKTKAPARFQIGQWCDFLQQMIKMNFFFKFIFTAIVSIRKEMTENEQYNADITKLINRQILKIMIKIHKPNTTRRM